MSRAFRSGLLASVALMVVGVGAQAQSADPSARIGRLAYLQGTVSYHDAQQDSWAPAVMNTPLTTGGSLWTEPSGHDEIALAGTRVRMDGDTQLDFPAIDDNQTRLQLDQGRLDIKAFALDANQPYQIVTPRGTVTLEQQGDYYIHAGSITDPTLIGVRSGAAQLQTPNGETLSLHAGQVGEVTGVDNGLQVNTIQSAPPAEPAYWAQRDRQVTYAQPQYVTADMTGYEDLAAYGSWTNDPTYGEVWSPNTPPAGWAPYRTGAWVYQAPYGWTWVDAQPWGFAPYHYGRWAQRADRWYWVPPQRAERPVYAPALVAFIGGVELGVALGEQSRGPVGWFPLGPREAYVPPYATDRGYFNRINSGDRVEAAMLDDRWQRAERHEAIPADPQHQMMNRRFATVVPAEDFAHSRPVQQTALKVSADKLAAAPVSPVFAPPAATSRPGQQANLATIGRPAPAAQARPAAGPRIEARASAPANGKPPLPPLAPHTASAPPRLEGERTPAVTHANPPAAVPQANRAEPGRTETPRATEPPRPETPRPEQRPAETHAPTTPAAHTEAPRAVAPRPEPPRAEPPHAEPPHQAEAPRPQPPHEAPHAEAPHPAPAPEHKEEEKK